MRRVAVIEHGQREYVSAQLTERAETEICLFAEWEPNVNEHNGIPVAAIDSLSEGDYDVLLIAVKENRFLSRLLTYLHDKGIRREVYVLRLFTMDKKLPFFAEDVRGGAFDMQRVDRIPEDKPYLVHLETHVCDHCNLNCKQCNNFSPFVESPRYADPALFERDLERLSTMFSRIGRFFLLGGEPLLAPELCCEMVRAYRRHFPEGELRVLTNATLVKAMRPEFWECLRENDVIVHISLYPPVKPHISEIVRRLEEERVLYLIHREVTAFSKHWTLYPFEDAALSNERCGSGGCHYLRDGLLSKCPDALLIGNMSGALGMAEESLNSADAILLTDTGEDAREIIRRLDGPCDLCKRCTFNRMERKQWEQVDGKPDPSDWMLPHRFEAENKRLSEKIEILHNTVAELSSENAKMEHSLSFRIGRAITWLPRKVRGMFK